MKQLIIFTTLALGALVTVQAAEAGGDKAQRAQKAMAELESRFNAADANHDGRLTREEAKGKMPRVAQNFDAIDAQKNGYVTLDDIKAYAKEKMMERQGQ
ncbi:hypothetical protein [Chitinimonas sp.]|uniref:hypothetical protein n=1 Tax=Chitinimonas sp. TaxID=1934313 RepID=UPI002F92DCDF